MIGRAVAGLPSLFRSGRAPSRRAIAALVKLCGYRPQRRWPFLSRVRGDELNLGFEDILEFQFARSKRFTALVVGAFDGVTNDPSSRYVLGHGGRSIFVEPQPGAFARLSDGLRGQPNAIPVNAAIDARSGARTMYSIRPGVAGLPAWTEQIASFSREHVLSHEARVPGLSEHLVEKQVPTTSFADLLDAQGIDRLDLLQIDAEGFDAQLIAWFPFERLRPGIVYYEKAHLSPEALQATRQRLEGFGYLVLKDDFKEDDAAVLF